MDKSKNNSKKDICKDILYGFLRIVILLGMSFAIFSTVFSFRIIHGNNMFPYLMDGDLALLYCRPSDVKNEIVIYKHNNNEYCGRIVAKAGDKVDFKEGKLFVNGIAQVADITYYTDTPDDWVSEQIVPEDYVFILNDYRSDDNDSRQFGFISQKNVIYKIISIIRHKRF